MRPHFHENISEQFTIRKCMRPSFEGSVNMEDVDEDDYLRKEVSCGKTNYVLNIVIRMYLILKITGLGTVALPKTEGQSIIYQQGKPF